MLVLPGMEVVIMLKEKITLGREDASKPIGMKLSVTLHSDEARRNSGVKRWKAP